MYNTVKGNLKPIKDKVLVSDMHFGEQKTASGLIIKNDDGTTRGIYPRWGKVYAKGPDNIEDYKIGDWILIEHGRWTRGITLDDGNGEKVVRMVENSSVLMYSEEKPSDVYIGSEYNDGDHATVDPSAFVNSTGALSQ